MQLKFVTPLVSQEYPCQDNVQLIRKRSLFKSPAAEKRSNMPQIIGGNHHLMSSSFAKMIIARALGVSSKRLMILSNSPGLGSRGIFSDWAMQRPPVKT